MRIVKAMGICCLLGLLSACTSSSGGNGNGGTVSVTSEGTCTSEFISDYNSIVNEAKLLKSYIDYKSTSSEISHQAQVLKNACDVFFPKHENVSCKAIVEYKETTIDSNSQKKTCDSAQKVLDLLK